MMNKLDEIFFILFAGLCVACILSVMLGCVDRRDMHVDGAPITPYQQRLYVDRCPRACRPCQWSGRVDGADCVCIPCHTAPLEEPAAPQPTPGIDDGDPVDALKQFDPY